MWCFSSISAVVCKLYSVEEDPSVSYKWRRQHLIYFKGLWNIPVQNTDNSTIVAASGALRILTSVMRNHHKTKKWRFGRVFVPQPSSADCFAFLTSLKKAKQSMASDSCGRCWQIVFPEMRPKGLENFWFQQDRAPYPTVDDTMEFLQR